MSCPHKSALRFQQLCCILQRHQATHSALPTPLVISNPALLCTQFIFIFLVVAAYGPECGSQHAGEAGHDTLEISCGKAPYAFDPESLCLYLPETSLLDSREPKGIAFWPKPFWTRQSHLQQGVRFVTRRHQQRTRQQKGSKQCIIGETALGSHESVFTC